MCQVSKKKTSYTISEDLLTFTTFWVNSAGQSDDNFFYFSQKIGFDISNVKAYFLGKIRKMFQNELSIKENKIMIIILGYFSYFP